MVGKGVNALERKRVERILIPLLFVVLIALIAAIVMWPGKLAEEMSEVERITNLLPIATTAIYGIGYFIANNITEERVVYQP